MSNNKDVNHLEWVNQEEDLHSVWKHRWINQKLVYRQSERHGMGFFAKEDLKKGEPVFVVSGVVVPRWDILEYRKKMGHIGIQIDDDFFLCPTSKNDVMDTGAANHSCKPNVGLMDSSVKVVAIKDIGVGEEIFADYAFFESYFEPFECRCGSRNCRGVIRPDDWKRRDIQEKYLEYFSPYLKRKVDAMVCHI